MLSCCSARLSAVAETRTLRVGVLQVSSQKKKKQPWKRTRRDSPGGHGERVGVGGWEASGRYHHLANFPRDASDAV